MGDLRTRMPAREALKRIREFAEDVVGFSPHMATVPPSITNALDDLEAFVDDMLHDAPVDTLALKRLLDNANWVWREDWGRFFAYHGTDAISNALNWECSTCRPDVGWAKWDSARKDKDGVITLHVECGHCGADYDYDADGNEL